MAPDARIISLKVANADGGTDVSQVIAAIDWVVQHAHDDGLNIRVLNLSYGTNGAQAYTVDPLAFAAEQAWKHGITVVAAGGNDGFQRKKRSRVGRSRHRPVPDRSRFGRHERDPEPERRRGGELLPRGPKKVGPRSVDLVAPGAHVQGLRVPNSFIDANNPKGVISDRYFRGSGTSESTAITTGAVALILQKYPDATPDQVKKSLTSSAAPINGTAQAIGAGELQLGPALHARAPSGRRRGPRRPELARWNRPAAPIT